MLRGANVLRDTKGGHPKRYYSTGTRYIKTPQMKCIDVQINKKNSKQ
jgi:hypothetical protein